MAAPASASDPDGTIEICKSAKNGMAGKPFSFSLNGGAPIVVNGGACSGPLVAPSGNNTVVEAPTPGLEVKKIKAKKALVSADLSTGTAVVKVKSGSTPANETLVTFINKRVPSLGLKVCKQTSDPTLLNDLYSFTENGGPAYSVAAGPVGSPNCGPVHKYQLDTVVNVAELAVPGSMVSAITVSDDRGSNFNTAAGTVSVTIGTGVTVVTYTNIVPPVPQFGYIEVCKYADYYDWYVSGDFEFTITAPGFTLTESVVVGQCTAPIQVPAGNVNVVETAKFPFYVSAIAAYPSGRLVTSNLVNQTATVVVPKGDEASETVVVFWNATRLGHVKVCKTLTANSAALAGHTFAFTVVDDTIPTTVMTNTIGEHTVYVTAGAAGSTTCVIDPYGLPLGTHVSITEQEEPNIKVTAVTVAPASQDLGSAPPTANLVVGAGVTTATFTNMAFGTIEVCKAAADRSTATQTFAFSVNAGAPIYVKAGQCSAPISVPAGTATVYELPKTNFHLVSVGVEPLDRFVSGLNPVVVAVPYGGVENETVVTFTNAVDTGQFKICKESIEPTLQDVTFEFNWSVTIYGTPYTGTAYLKPGECSSLSVSIPVVDANGLPIPVTVTETYIHGVAVSDITVANGTLYAADLANRTAVIYVNKGVTTITFHNVRRDVPEIL